MKGKGIMESGTEQVSALQALSRLGIGSGVVYHRISILSQVTSVSKVDRTAKTNSCHSDHAHTQLDTGLVYREE